MEKEWSHGRPGVVLGLFKISPRIVSGGLRMIPKWSEVDLRMVKK